MASSSNQTTDRREREKTAAADGETIWELGPVRSRMTQNALGDHFVDQFQDNSEKEPATALGNQQSNVNRAQIPTVKIEPENKSESSFSDYFKKTYNGSSNKITRTVTAIPDQKVSAAARLVHGDMTGLGTMMNFQGGLTGLGTTMNLQGGVTGLANTLNHQGGVTGLGATLNYQGGLTGLGTLNQPKNWEMNRGMRGGCDLMEVMRPGSNASSSGMRGPTDLIQSRADEFRFRMGLLERENMRPTSMVQGDISNSMAGLAGQMTLEEIEAQKQKTLMNLQQLEQAQNVKQRMELEAQRKREVMAKARLEYEMMKRREAMEREDDEMMKLIQAEQAKLALVKQSLSLQAENSGMGEKSRQEDIDRLQKEVDMLKKQMNLKSEDNSAVKPNNVPARSGVKYRLGVATRLGDSQEVKKRVFSRLGQADELKEFGDTQQGNVEHRWKRGIGEKDSRKRKNDMNDGHELPADLVLTELSDAGPVPAKASRVIPRELVTDKASGAIPQELVLTEFGENGPIKVQTELEKLEARARRVSKNK